MHIGMFSNNSHIFTNGGSENHVRDLSRALVRQGNKVTIVTNCSHAVASDSYMEGGVRIIIKKQRRTSLSQSKTFTGETWKKIAPVFDYRDMYKLLSSLNCDIYHQHDLSSNYLTTKKMVANGFKTVLTNHLGEYLLLKRYLPDFMLRAALKPYAAIIGPSEELTPTGLHPFTSEIWNGFDHEVFKPNENVRTRVRQTLGLDAQDVLIVVPRRWAPTKGVIYAAEAARRLDGVDNIKWLFLGQNSPGYTEYKLDIRSKLAGLANVKIHDSVSPEILNEFFNAADICLIPSLMEAVSIAAIEAMASGCVVVASEVGGMPSLLQHDRTGMLFEPKNVNAITDIVERLAENRSFLLSISQASASFVKDRLTWDNVACQTMKVYEAAIRG